ncbi:hypothetical protein HOP52_12430 [Halomonas campisalis]|uniref:Uncharacterized protein n=1 Tax=Billgrantia campisalis TaxID=74661 RepID=A0ABS9PAQ6_9GAMM|nr:hypothetical protein [Halomonas campisalis]MCG6658559.1 hypothetical protein [Halomonas campisalis]MDR5863420.1 hypothetical protein [Halomonas campisalis]
MPTPLRHSSLGIVSLLIALFGAVFLAGLAVAASIIATSAAGENGGHPQGISVVGVELLFLLGLQLIALGMGVAALRRTDERRLFGALGTATAALVMVAAVALTLTGRLA